jgi:ABC-type phosphate/phosphonate transport system substrate-binding protein
MLNSRFRLFAVLFFSAVLLTGRTSRAEEPPLYFAFYNNASSYIDAQSRISFKALTDYLNLKSGHKVVSEEYTDLEKVKTRLATREPTFFYAYNRQLIKTALENDYVPLAGITVLGATTTTACFYVNKTSTINSLADLKGKRLLSTDGPYAYYALREAIGKKDPLLHFKTSTIFRTGMSALYSLTLNQGEVAFVYDNVLTIMEQNNPGPLKKIRKLACGNFTLPLAPFFIHKRVPEDQKALYRKLGYAATTAPEFKQFHPLWKATDFRVIPFDLALLADYNKLGTLAEKEKWAAGYTDWEKLTTLE